MTIRHFASALFVFMTFLTIHSVSAFAQDSSASSVSGIGLTLGPDSGGGALVAGVLPGSVADQAHLQVGDLIVGINTVDITNAVSMNSAISSAETDAGSASVALRIMRQGQLVFVGIQLPSKQFGSNSTVATSKPGLSGGDPHWIKDAALNCWGHDAAAESEEAISWTGTCRSHLIAGPGTLTISVNGIVEIQYSGTAIKGTLSGLANVIEYWENGDRSTYATNFDSLGDSIPYGPGSVTSTDGSTRSAHWISGNKLLVNAPYGVAESLCRTTSPFCSDWRSFVYDDPDPNAQAISNSSQDQQSSDNTPTSQDYVNALQNSIGQSQQNINGQLQQMQQA